MKLQIVLCALFVFACQKDSTGGEEPKIDENVERLKKLAGNWTESGSIYARDAGEVPLVASSRCDALSDGIVCYGTSGAAGADPTFAWMETIIWDAPNKHYIKWDQTNQSGLATAKMTGTWNGETGELTFSGKGSPITGEGHPVRHVYQHKDDGSIQLRLYEKVEDSERKVVEVLKKRK